MTRSDVWKQRPAVMRYRAFKDDLRANVRGKLDPCFDIVFLVPMPKSWSKKEKALMLNMPHQVKPDIDNYLKAFMDAMEIDDAYIYDVHSRKYWTNTDTGRIILHERGNEQRGYREN